MPSIKKFGRLIVVEEFWREGKNRRDKFWRCICECGNEKTLRANLLTTGQTKSCGCLHRERSSKFMKEFTKTYKTPKTKGIKTLYSIYKHVAKRRNLNFEIERNHFEELIFQNCFYCNKEPSTKFYHSDKEKTLICLYNGIDRENNDLGYVDGNCVPCCRFCNTAKMNLSRNEFLKNVEMIYEHSIKNKESKNENN